GAAVEALDREPLGAAAPHVLDERGQRRAQPSIVRLAQRDERATAPFDEERGFTSEQDNVRAGNARSAGAGTLRPRHRCAVRLRRIRGRENQRLGLLAVLAAQLTQALDCARQRELPAAETFHELA